MEEGHVIARRSDVQQQLHHRVHLDPGVGVKRDHSSQLRLPLRQAWTKHTGAAVTQNKQVCVGGDVCLPFRDVAGGKVGYANAHMLGACVPHT